MKIGIDGYFMVGKKTGMGNMLFNILLNLSEEFIKRNTVIVYLPERMSKENEDLLRKNNIKIKILKKKIFPIWEQITINREAKKDKIDIFWFPFNTGCLNMKCKKIVTIHDVIYMKGSIFSPKTWYKKAGLIYRRVIVPQIAKKCDYAITVSKFSLKEVTQLFPKVNNKIDIVYNAVDFKNRKLSNDKWLEYKKVNGINCKYILAPGSLEKRKNVLNVIKAFEKIKDKKIQLVLYGFKGWENSNEKKYIEDNNIKNVIVMGYISDDELATLYENSEIFIFASTYEGFGIPIIEAMHFDVPVITSNVTCLPEVAGNAALYVNPFDVGSITDSIEELLVNEELREKLKILGRKNIKRFNWKVSAQRVEKILNHVGL